VTAGGRVTTCTASDSVAVVAAAAGRLQYGAGVATEPGNTLGIRSSIPACSPRFATFVEVLDDNGVPIGGLDADSFSSSKTTV